MNERSEAGERWLPVVGWEGWYSVSDLGRVRSEDRLEQCGATTRRRAGRVLRTRCDQNGRPCAWLHRDGSARSVRVQTLVAAAFHGPRPPGLLVRHWDDDRLNNRADNLLYGTKLDNYLDAARNGLPVRIAVETCSRGHRVGHPNFTDRADCLACSRARAAVKGRYGYGRASDDVRVVADWYYAEITGRPVVGVLPPREPERVRPCPGRHDPDRRYLSSGRCIDCSEDRAARAVARWEKLSGVAS